MTENTVHHLYLSDDDKNDIRLNIRFPLQIHDFIIDTYGAIKFGVIDILNRFYGRTYITRIDGLIDLDIFKNRQQAIIFATIYFYLSKNNILIGD